MADGAKVWAIVLTGLFTGGISSGSTYFLQQQSFQDTLQAQREQIRQQFQGSLITGNLNQFVAACVTDNNDQRTFFMRGVAQALECNEAEVQHCVIEHVRNNCGRLVSSREIAVQQVSAETPASEVSADAPLSAAEPEQPTLSMIEETHAPVSAAAPPPALGAGAAASDSKQASGAPDAPPVPKSAAPQARKGLRLFAQTPNVDLKLRLQPVDDALRTSGALGPDAFVANNIEVVRGYSGTTHVRYFRPEDRGYAEMTIKALQPYLPGMESEPRQIGGYEKQSGQFAGQVELWLSPDQPITPPSH